MTCDICNEETVTHPPIPSHRLNGVWVFRFACDSCERDIWNASWLELKSEMVNKDEQ